MISWADLDRINSGYYMSKRRPKTLNDAQDMCLKAWKAYDHACDDEAVSNETLNILRNEAIIQDTRYHEMLRAWLGKEPLK